MGKPSRPFFFFDSQFYLKNTDVSTVTKWRGVRVLSANGTECPRASLRLEQRGLNRAFVPQQKHFLVQPTCVSHQIAGRADHAMARHRDSDGILAIGRVGTSDSTMRSSSAIVFPLVVDDRPTQPSAAQGRFHR